MTGINKRQRAQRTRRARERRAFNPCTIKRQLHREQHERSKKRTFHPFLRLPAELKLRVMELADLDSISNLAGTCRSMWSLWSEKSEVIWNVVLKERYDLESRIIGPAESFPSFAELTGRKERRPKCQRTIEQEATIESAAQAVVMRRDTQWMHGGTFCAAPMTGLSTKARRGGFGYLKLLDEISRSVDADMKKLHDDLASAGVIEIESFRSAVLLLWRMQWWKIESVPDPASFLIKRKRFRVLGDDERITLFRNEPVESKNQFGVLLEILAWKLGTTFNVQQTCCSAIDDERRLEEEDGRDKQIPQLQALFYAEMEAWLMREVIERGLSLILYQIRDPDPDLQSAAQRFCLKKVAFLRRSNLRDIISEKGVWMERQMDLVSRIKEIWDQGKLPSFAQ